MEKVTCYKLPIDEKSKEIITSVWEEFCDTLKKLGLEMINHNVCAIDVFDHVTLVTQYMENAKVNGNKFPRSFHDVFMSSVKLAAERKKHD